MAVSRHYRRSRFRSKGAAIGSVAKVAHASWIERRSGRNRGEQCSSAAAKTLERFVQYCAALMSVRSSRLPGAALAAVACALLAGAAGCAHRDYFPGTTIVRSEENRKIIETVEEYRQRLMQRNVVGLLALASPRYFEDSGTPRSDDDYGYDGLKAVLETQLPRVKSLRYDIEYRNIRVSGNEAEVEVFLDGSFEISAPEAGDRYRRVNDYHRFVLEREGDEWKFLAGM
jgi:hypothetical protein